MNGKDLLQRFRSTSWQTEEAADAFAAGVEGASAPELVKLLDTLGGRSAEHAQARRCRCLAFGRLAERFGDKTLFVPLARALKSADAPLRAVLVRLLPSMNDVTRHQELVALLRSEDAGLRAAVVTVLAEIGGRTAFEALTDMVQEPAFPARAEGMDLLVALGAHRAVPALEGALAVGALAERIQAVRLLADPRCAGRDTVGVVRALVRALGDADEGVLTEALGVLGALCSEDELFDHVAPFLDHPAAGVVRAALEPLQRFTSPRALRAVQRLLRRGPNALRLAAIGVLEGMAVDGVVGLLVEALGHPNVVVRGRAGEALQRLSRAGKVNLVRTVVFLLRSRDLDVRRMAAELAHSVSDRDAELWPKLLEHLTDEDWWVRERVADALVEMAGAPLARHVVAMLKDPDDLLRRFAVDVLLRLRAPEALGALVRTATSDTDWWIRERAIEAIAALQDERAVPHIVDLMIREPPLRLACLQALTALRATVAAPHVAALLSAGEPDVTLAALQCLRVTGQAGQAAHVELLLSDARLGVRTLAREVLLGWEAAARTRITLPVPGISPLDRMLIGMAHAEGDDLILTPGRSPSLKRFGQIVPFGEEALPAAELRELLLPMLSLEQREALQERRDVDLSYEVKSEALRFRVNVFSELGGLSAVFRIIKGALLELEALGLPAVVHDFVRLREGLVLLGGPTGSGKSTTLAAVIDRINSTSSRHIISLEDPIEVVHRRKKSLVNQREVGSHARSFSDALRSTLREDPDVILIGEMRDTDTIAFGLTAAETGHLVFGTIHTSSAATTVDRVINASPPGRQHDVRAMLAGSLRAVVCQTLLRRADAPGRVLAAEVLLNSDAVANLIRKGKTFQIPSVIATSREAGMQLMDTELMRLCREGKISGEDAYLKAVGKKDFEAFVSPEQARPS